MSNLTLDEAIKHCLEVAEQNKAQADKISRQLIGSAIDKYATDCRECAADHRKLAEWLTEMKELREENKVLMQECDRLIKEKGELLSKVSGGDVLRICQLEEQLKDWKEEYANLNKISYGFYEELKEAKRLLKAAVEDFAKLDRVNTKVRNCMMPEMDCADCPLSWDSVDDSVEPCHNWRYTNEALKLIES